MEVLLGSAVPTIWDYSWNMSVAMTAIIITIAGCPRVNNMSMASSTGGCVRMAGGMGGSVMVRGGMGGIAVLGGGTPWVVGLNSDCG